MNERNKKMTVIMYWCLFVTFMGFHVCSGYTRHTIKDYNNNKDYLVAASNVVNKFEDNEIRGESKFSAEIIAAMKIRSVVQQFCFFVSHRKFLQFVTLEAPKGEISLCMGTQAFVFVMNRVENLFLLAYIKTHR